MNTSAIIGVYIGFMVVIPFLLKKKRTPVSIPNIVTTLGVLGTFIGIAWGLYDFDVKHIEDSVPKLLSGLKLAFTTSIAGMSLSILIKVFPGIYGLKKDSEIEGATLDTLASLLEKSNEISALSAVSNEKQLKSIESALTGDGETTLLTQMQKLRTTLIDKQDELLKAFNTFAEKMVEDTRTSFIEALTEVVKDFNTLINEQFGENFKELNLAVGRLLEWQENYRVQLDGLMNQQKAVLESIQRCEQSLVKITEQSETFQTTANSLDKILTGLNDEVEDLHDHLSAFSELADNAKNAFPVIHENINQITNNFKDTVTLNQESIVEQANLLKEAHTRLNGQITEVTRELNTNINRLMQDNAKRIANQVSELNKSLGEQLNQSLKTLGDQLASLSDRFVQDYKPLTERLRDVVRIAKKLEGDGQK